MKHILLFLIIFSSQAFATEALLLFGGKNHDQYIGCLNCGKYDDGSVCNKYGDYGSKYSDKSIWNKYGDYGSKYNDESPWNKYGSNPPVIVDKNGDFYGYFAASKYQDKRTEIKTYVYLLDNVDIVYDDLEKARDWLCE